jgi:hypothetical protein
MPKSILPEVPDYSSEESDDSSDISEEHEVAPLQALDSS